MSNNQEPQTNRYEPAQELKHGYPSGRTPASEVPPPAAALRPSPGTAPKAPAPEPPAKDTNA